MKAQTEYPSVSVRPTRNGGTKRIGGRVKDILIAFAVMTLPMLLFSALLLGLIFHLRVVHNGFVSSNLAFANGRPDSNAIYVRISSTTLITIASWSSTLAPILVGFAITLVSYPVSRSILQAGNNDQPQQLPTPYQLSLLLQILANGSPASLWHWLRYSLGWRGRRERQGRPIKAMVIILILGLLLSTLVLVTDTWLHFSTKTVNFVQTRRTTMPSNPSFGLTEACTDVQQTYTGGCSLNIAAAGAFLMNGSTALKVLSNISETTLVSTYEHDGHQFAYLGIAPQPQLKDVDFTATSWTVETECKPVTSQCIDEAKVYGAAAPYKCPFAFEGLLSTPNKNVMTMAYFTDSSASNNRTGTESIKNPYYFAAITQVNRNIGRSEALGKDPEIASSGHGGVLTVLFCNATVYDLEYTSVNGSIARFVTVSSNSSMANIIQGTQQYTAIGDQALLQAASVAALGDTAQNMADSFALSYSQTALAASAGVFVQRPAVESQRRESILVARVPKAPLACLILANLLLVVLGTVLTVMAFLSLRGDTNEVQARLSIPALVAAQFEGSRIREPVENVEEMFEESNGVPGPRVGFRRTDEGGWIFGSWTL